MVVISSPSTVLRDGAGAAERHAAAEFCPGESENVAQIPQQRHFGIAVECLGVSVHLEMNHAALPGNGLASENTGLFYCGSSVWMQMASGLKKFSVFLCVLGGSSLRPLRLKLSP